jgi:hypothetical protein
MDSIGVQGGSIPGLKEGGMQPTIQLADLSRSFAAEVFERRAMVGTIVWASTADYVGIMEIKCQAVGGIVIESLSVIDGDPPYAGTDGSPGFRMTITESPLLAGVTFPVEPLNIGGNAVKSTMRRGEGPDASWYGSHPWAFISPLWELQPTTIWVRPGSYLTLGSAAFNTSTDVSAATVNMVWREIPEIQGAAS